jgi:hypothetical protein
VVSLAKKALRTAVKRGGNKYTRGGFNLPFFSKGKGDSNINLYNDHKITIDQYGTLELFNGNITKIQDSQSEEQIKKRRNDTPNIDKLIGSIYIGNSTFYSVHYNCQQLPMYLKTNGLFSEGKYEYIYKNKNFMRITQSDFGDITTWQILSISHHQLDWSILWLLNIKNGELSLWNSKMILEKFPTLKHTEKLYNCILVGYVKSAETPVFLKPDGWFSDGTYDYWPTYNIVKNSSSIESYEFKWYQVVGDKFKGLIGKGKTGKYRGKEGVTLDALTLSESQQKSLKQHYMDYQTILDINVNGKFTNDRLQLPKWRVNQLDELQRNKLVGSILVGIFIGNINTKKKWVFLKEDGWFSDGKDDYWPNYELYATKNGGLYYTFDKFNVVINTIDPSLYFLYNTNFNMPLIGTGMALSAVWGAEYDIAEFLNYLGNMGIEAGIGVVTAFKGIEVHHLLSKGSTTKKTKKKHGGQKTKYKRIKIYRKKGFSI